WAIAPAYQAAQAAGVRRFIYLSTMCVHGQAPVPGTDESSPLIAKYDFSYNNAKIYAEQKLLKLRSKGSVEVVIFRPGIVFGPRSRWIRTLADELLQKTVYLIQNGQGICNTTYVDNLVHGMELAIAAPEADGQAFFIGEDERITWADFYQPVAEALGISLEQIPSASVPEFKLSQKQRFASPIWNSVLVQKSLALVGDDFKQKLKQSLPRQKKSQPSVSKPPSISQAWKEPVVSREMAALQQSQYKLPLQKAQQLLGYEPLVSWKEANAACLDWLMKEGYPIQASRMKTSP
ncbi:MAG: NAD-dependent epimerase/dehydratase family protein, partial [Leptolyngbya sp. SIO1D8]|nr:NAD-dependent epimerase/dehydratase family protein [Leptolyngbya sp. SIO1D8]